MAVGVVSVGRLTYAVGLYWENSPGGGRVAQIAREAAKQQEQPAAFFAARSGNKDGRVPQFGLSPGGNGQAARMPVLAANLASQIPGSWAGAFRLNEGTAVIVVRDDLIVPDGDLFFFDESEARNRLIQEIGFGGLQVTYAPETWSIPGADTIPLPLLLNDRKDVVLQAVSISPGQKKLLIGVSVMLALAVGGVVYWQIQEANEEAAAAAKAALDAANRAKNAPKPVATVIEPKYERLWENAPPVNAYIENCRVGLSKVRVAIVGWHLTGLKCSGNALTLVWGHEKGRAETPDNFTINPSGNGATQTITLPPLNPRGSEELLDTTAITKVYLAQDWPATLSPAPNDPPPQPPPGYAGAWSPGLAPWIKRSFTLSVPQLPGGVPQIIGDLPGVIVTGATFTPGTPFGSWNIEGVIYENKK